MIKKTSGEIVIQQKRLKINRKKSTDKNKKGEYILWNFCTLNSAIITYTFLYNLVVYSYICT